MSNYCRKGMSFCAKKTGDGKSLCYQGFSSVCNVDNCVVLVITPLTAIMQEQCDFLNTLGIKAAMIGKDKDKDIEKLEGNTTYVFTSPETIVGQLKWRNMVKSRVYQERLVLFAVDEAHVVTQW